jgi:O-antigen chain-terminating methyltransferase
LHYSPLPIEQLFRFETELAYRQDFLALAVPPAAPTFRERTKALFKKLFRLGLRWVLIRQVEFNQALLRHVRESARLFTLLDRSMGELVGKLAEMQNQVENLNGQNEQLRQELASVQQKNQQLADTLVAYRLRWKRLQQSELPSRDELLASSPIDYFLFENQFGGTREAVMARQRAYLPYFQGHGPVLDIGCGRGEFVELLAAEGLPVTGIDSNADMADYCRELGLPVLHAEGLHYLHELEDHSLDGIFLGRVVEHLPPERIVGLLAECWAKLSKGGVLVVETANPLCRTAWEAFSRDPTHVRPVHPELLRFLFQEQQFTICETIYTAPVEEEAEPVVKTTDPASVDASRYQNYALVGHK